MATSIALCVAMSVVALKMAQYLKICSKTNNKSIGNSDR